MIAKVVVWSPADFKKYNAEIVKHPNWKAANVEFSAQVAPLIKSEAEESKTINEDWSRRFNKGRDSMSTAEMNAKIDTINRKYILKKNTLMREVFGKYGFGDVGVSAYEYRQLQDALNPDFDQLGKLETQQAVAYTNFSDSLGADIKNAGGPSKLRYDVAGELDKFSQKTKDAYDLHEKLALKVRTLRDKIEKERDTFDPNKDAMEVEVVTALEASEAGHELATYGVQQHKRKAKSYTSRKHNRPATQIKGVR